MNKRITKQPSIPMSIGGGLLISILTTVVGGLILAILIDREVIAEKWIGYGVGVLVFTAAVFSAWTAVRKYGKNKLPVAIVTSIAYVLLLLAVNALFFSGEYEGVLPQIMLIFGAGACVGMLSVMRNNSGNRR